MVPLITSPICQTKDYQDYKNLAKYALLIHNEVSCWYYKRTTSKTEYYVMNVSAFTYNWGEKQPVSLVCLTSCLRFCRSHSMRINLFCYPCLFILSVKLLMLFNFIYYLKSSNFKSSILQHSLLPYLQTESNVKSPWQQLSRVWIIIGFIASFIIHSKINNFRYISLMYY